MSAPCSIHCKAVVPSKYNTATRKGLHQAEAEKIATFSVHLANSKGDPCIKACDGIIFVFYPGLPHI